MTARFVKPVYDGEELEVAWWNEFNFRSGDMMRLELLGLNGAARVVGSASASPLPSPPAWDEYETSGPTQAPDGAFPLEGVPPHLPELAFEVDASDPTLKYMMEIVASHVGASAVPPAFVASAASRIMSMAFDFTGPRIHLETVITQFREATPGDWLRARCRIGGFRTSEERWIVKTDTLVVDEWDEPVVHTLNTGLYAS